MKKELQSSKQVKSKSSLELIAEELLSSEMLQIKGGISSIGSDSTVVPPSCGNSCQNGCQSFCQPGCAICTSFLGLA